MRKALIEIEETEAERTFRILGVPVFRRVWKGGRREESRIGFRQVGDTSGLELDENDIDNEM